MRFKRFPELSGMLTGLEMMADGGGDNGGGAGSAGGAAGDPPGSGQGGDTASGGDDPFKKEGGLEAIRALRSELKQSKDLIRSLESRVDPEVFAKTQADFEAAQQRVREQESHLKLREKEIVESFSGQLREANDRATNLATQLDTMARQQAGRDFWVRADGVEADFQVFWELAGKSALRREDDGTVFVADEKGTPVLGEDGKRINPVEWAKTLATTNPLLLPHFKASVGSGSGSNGGRRMPSTGVDIHKLSKSELFGAFNE